MLPTYYKISYKVKFKINLLQRMRDLICRKRLVWIKPSQNLNLPTKHNFEISASWLPRDTTHEVRRSSCRNLSLYQETVGSVHMSSSCFFPFGSSSSPWIIACLFQERQPIDLPTPWILLGLFLKQSSVGTQHYFFLYLLLNLF